MITTKKKKTSKSSRSPKSLSFSSLPYDVALNCLARVPVNYHQTLSLVSKTLQTLISSREVHATRNRIGLTERYLYVCLNVNKNKHDPRWFVLSPSPNQPKKLKPIPPFPFPQYPITPTVLPVDSQIYVIGGYLDKDISRSVFCLDCRSNEWRRLPDMLVARRHPAADADVIDGKICVVGGDCSSSPKHPDWGEVYDPKTQTWEPIPKTELDLTVEKRAYQHGMVMGGKVFYRKSGGKWITQAKSCMVELENKWYQIWIYDGKLSSVLGLEKLSTRRLVAVESSGGGRVIVWWRTVEELGFKKKGKTRVSCAEISLERRSSEEIWGVVQWSSSVLTLEDGWEAKTSFFNSSFVLHSAVVTH